MAKKQAKSKKRPRTAKAAPRRRVPTDDFIGRLKGQFQIVGDILSPVESPDAWQYDLNNLDSKPKRQS